MLIYDKGLPGMFRSRGHFFGLGLIVIGLGLGLGLMKYWSRSYIGLVVSDRLFADCFVSC